MVYCGFDFGTSNTVVSVWDESSDKLRVFSDPSLIFLPESEGGIQERFIGKEAITKYLDSGMKGRFIQAIKSSLPDEHFRFTMIHGKRYSLEDLTAMIIRHFKVIIEAELGVDLKAAVFGRPYQFSEIPERDRLAERRLRAAAEQAGFKEIHFLYEPIAAAYEYEKQIQGEATVLIADLGGGTSDFSVVKLENKGNVSEAVLGTGGVHVGGQDLDSRIMWNEAVEEFGWGTKYESWGKMLPVPIMMYRTICTWERIPFLKNNSMREELKYILNGAEHKGKIQRIIDLIDHDLGYGVFQAIQECKHGLSESDAAEIIIQNSYFSFSKSLHELNFRKYIQEEREALSLEAERISKWPIQKVFMTGGTSLVPSIRQDFQRLFPEAEIISDTQMFNSVSKGLVAKAIESGLGNGETLSSI
jgi:hypothetical chaperone protein